MAATSATAALSAPPIGEIGLDTAIGRRLRVADVDDTHVTAEVSYSPAGAPFNRDRSTRIRIRDWRRRVPQVETVDEPAAVWRDQAGQIQRLSTLDIQTLTDVAAGAVSADSRFPKHDLVDRRRHHDRLPTWVTAPLVRLGLATGGDPQDHPATRPGMNLPHQVAVYRPTGDGQHLVQSLRDGVARCRVCGCTEDRACPGGCWWVPDPQLGDLCSACPTGPDPHTEGPRDGIA